MATKRLRDTRNYSENARTSILDRRVTSLFKKVEELSILCDIEVAIIIFKPGSIQPIAWKSASLAQDVLTRYLSCEANDEIKSIVKHETYLQKKAKKKEKEISKLEKMNEEKEMELLFNQLVEGKNINELDARQMKGLLKVCAAKTARINERKEQLKQPLNPPSNNENVILPASPTGDLFNDSWFIETMTSLGYGSGIRYGSGTKSAPTKGNDTNVGDNGHSKDLD
ncbi:MADS-box transcription factor PHERES 2-like [Solanum pennellii]|uniref:MADS-box transcription factor PHERES 2-like n=1 Tax=Solanum pennellii TaxID=28526 RepID=A0ABM1FSA9_SOLPN|nr:MADS-box transcription factor PHERES 2-like [Solanum pennellii]